MLPTFRRFTISDYANAPDWAAQMFNPLNIFCEQTVQTLNKNLVIGQNVQGQKFNATFTLGTSYSSGVFPELSFSYTGGGQPNCCLVGKIERTDGTQILTPVSVTQWYLNLNTNPYQVVVQYIAGLTNSAKYNVTLVVL